MMISVARKFALLKRKTFSFPEKHFHKLLKAHIIQLDVENEALDSSPLNLFNYRSIKQTKWNLWSFRSDILMQLCKTVINFIMQV